MRSPPPPGLSKEPGERESLSLGCVVQIRPFEFGSSLRCVGCWLLSFFSPEVLVQGGLVRASGFRSRVFNSALARLAGCRARGVRKSPVGVFMGLSHLPGGIYKSRRGGGFELTGPCMAPASFSSSVQGVRRDDEKGPEPEEGPSVLPEGL